jgi:glycogen debranching enzyme
VRRFWRGDADVAGALATRLSGSADLYAARHRGPVASVNFIAAHDGFTLADLVAYAHKHNEANGEGNRDGDNDSHSWNNGVEGSSRDATVKAARDRDIRSLLATLFLSRGIPMLQAGDEFGRTQFGNNNAYCQDNAGFWLDWESADLGLAAFVAGLAALRKSQPLLRGEAFLTGQPLDDAERPDATWLRADGAPVGDGDWQQLDTFALLLADTDAAAMIAVNRRHEPSAFALPEALPGRAWRRLFSSAAARDDDALPARSVSVLVETR